LLFSFFYRFDLALFTRLLEQVWVLERASAYSAARPPLLLPVPPACSVCGRTSDRFLLAYVLLRPESARTLPVTAHDMTQYERLILHECSLDCHLANAARMLAPVHSILRQLGAAARGRPPNPASLYAEWTDIQYLTERSLVLTFLRANDFVHEPKVGFIPATESRRPDVVKAVTENAVVGDVLRYVDNLLLHDGDDLDCEHHEVIWEGAGEIVMPNRGMHDDELPDVCEFRLVACSSIDQHSRDTEAWDQKNISKAVLRIHDILGWIRIRIWIRGSMPLTNEFGLLFKGTCTSFSKIKNQKEVTKRSRNQGFSYFLCLVIEGSGSGSLPLTDGSGSRRSKNVWIRNTAIKTPKRERRSKIAC
jgi:hypothetical protein